MLLWFMLFISNGVNVSVIIFLALNLLCEVFFFLRDSMEHHHLAGVVSSSHSNGKWGIKHICLLCFNFISF